METGRTGDDERGRADVVMTDMPFCQWYLDDIGGDSVWETECKRAFEFNSDGPKENEFKFCPYCGRQLTPVLHSEESKP